MPDTADIRDWIKANRPDIHTQRGRLNAAQKEAWNDEHPDDPVLDGQVTEVQPAEPESPETPPEPAKRSIFSRKPAEPKARKVHRRASTDQILSGMWMIGAHAVGKNPNMIPTARCLALQAPAAGIVLDDAIRGTIVDKALQPLARAGKKGEAIASVIGPPVIVTAIAQRPELYPVLRPVLRELLASYILVAGPKIRRAQEREKKLLEELGGDLSTIDAMIESLFAPVEEPDGAFAASSAA